MARKFQIHLLEIGFRTVIQKTIEPKHSRTEKQPKSIVSEFFRKLYNNVMFINLLIHKRNVYVSIDSEIYWS